MHTQELHTFTNMITSQARDGAPYSWLWYTATTLKMPMLATILLAITHDEHTLLLCWARAISCQVREVCRNAMPLRLLPHGSVHNTLAICHESAALALLVAVILVVCLRHEWYELGQPLVSLA